MTDRALKQIVTTAAVVGLVAVLATVSLIIPGVGQLYPPRLAATVAAGLLGLTMLLLATFLVVQALPNGRRVVRVTWLMPDGLFAVIGYALVPAFSWESLGAIAGPPFSTYTESITGLSGPWVLGLLFLAGRAVQLRREGARQS